jgi:hypothetical protein
MQLVDAPPRRAARIAALGVGVAVGAAAVAAGRHHDGAIAVMALLAFLSGVQGLATA